MTTFHSTEKDPDRLLRAIVIGWVLELGTTVMPNRKSFQILVN
jgi:hypothetical protein